MLMTIAGPPSSLTERPKNASVARGRRSTLVPHFSGFHRCREWADHRTEGFSSPLPPQSADRTADSEASQLKGRGIFKQVFEEAVVVEPIGNLGKQPRSRTRFRARKRTVCSGRTGVASSIVETPNTRANPRMVAARGSVWPRSILVNQDAIAAPVRQGPSGLSPLRYVAALRWCRSRSWRT